MIQGWDSTEFYNDKGWRCYLMKCSYEKAKKLYDDYLKIKPTNDYKNAIEYIDDMEYWKEE